MKHFDSLIKCLRVDKFLSLIHILHYQKELSSVSASIVGQMVYNDEIADALCETAIENQPEALILLGDLSNVGAYADHERMAAKLARVKAAGVDVYVVPGNHDLQQSSAADFEKIYADFGFNQAFSRDRDSLSYAVKINDDCWLLALDTNEEQMAYGHLSDKMCIRDRNQAMTAIWCCIRAKSMAFLIMTRMIINSVTRIH